MSNDPRYPGDDDDEAEGNKKTRLVMRPDVAEGSGDAPPRGGSVIGTTRLVGNIAQQSPGSGNAPGSGTVKMPQPKTQFVREGTVDIEPVAGWIVVVKGPGRGALVSSE